MSDATEFFRRLAPDMPTGSSTAFVRRAQPGDRVTTENVGSIGTVQAVYPYTAPYLIADRARVLWDDGDVSHEPLDELTVQAPATPERTQQP